MRARIELTEVKSTHILITDLNGPVSITNDATAVVEWLYDNDLLSNQTLFYIDSEGKKTELIHNGAGNFVGFRLLQ